MMLHMILGKDTKSVDLDDLNEKQLDDLDRIIMIIWKTRPAIHSTSTDMSMMESKTLCNDLLCVNG